MTLGDKLSSLRRTHNFTQEQLAELLGVSRQAVSKWESGTAYPETDKLIRISKLFDCSLDYLLRDDWETDGAVQADDSAVPPRKCFRERMSNRTLLGMPLWHVGRNAAGFIAVGYNARGVIAIGLRARGVVSLGLLSVGVISWGTVSLGLIALGALAVGLLSAGAFSVGVLSAGSVSLGMLSFGSVAFGDFSVGALSIGQYLAIGDRARAMIALGDTEATGTVFQKVGELSASELATVTQWLNDAVPSYLSWAKDIVMRLL